jgi:hypothetical protein
MLSIIYTVKTSRAGNSKTETVSSFENFEFQQLPNSAQEVA